MFPREMPYYSKWSHHTMQSVAVAISHRLEITNEIDHQQIRRQKLTVHRELYTVALVASDYS